MSKRAGRVAAMVMVSAAIAAGCGAAEPASEATPSTSTPSPPPTVPATDPPTTTVPPTRQPPVENVEQAVMEDLQEAWTHFDSAKQNPADVTTRSALDDYFSGEALNAATQRLDGFVARNLASRTSDQDPAHLVVHRISAVTDGAATVLACELDSNVLVEVGAAPDGTDALVNDEVVSIELEITMTRRADRWVYSGARSLGETEGDSCGSA